MFCLDCNSPIPAKRLAAVQNARYCVDCQTAHDEKLMAVRKVPPRLDELDAADFAIEPEHVALATTEWLR